MFEPYQAELRRRIRTHMSAKRMTDKQLAAALKHPHAQTVKRWLSDDPKRHQAISIPNVAKIADILGVSSKALDPSGKEAYDPDNRPPQKRRGGVQNADPDRLPDQHTPALGGLDDVIASDPVLSAFVELWKELPDRDRLDLLNDAATRAQRRRGATAVFKEG